MAGRPNRYFLEGPILERFKTVADSLCFRKKTKARKKMTMWLAAIGLFEISRERQALTFVLFYYVCCLYHIQRDKAAGLASIRVGNLQDLGSSPRSLTLSITFLLTLSYAAFPLKGHHTLLDPTCHVRAKINQRAMLW